MDDITEVIMQKEELKNRYFTDTLTGIPNRNKQIDILYKYGLSGKVAEWRSANGDIIGSGGPNQYSLPFTIDTLKDLCLTK